MNVDRHANFSRSILWTLLAVAVGGLFVYAGVLKAWNPVQFATDIRNFQILPYGLAVRLAFYLPWLEIACGLALILGQLRYGALTILSGLMVVFIGATIIAKVRGINLDCGCFGSVSKGLSFGSHMLIDLAILAALIALWLLPPRFQQGT